ncbi:MAG: hypothetical protein ACXVY5_10605 [Gaiellales bacterium]
MAPAGDAAATARRAAEARAAGADLDTLALHVAGVAGRYLTSLAAHIASQGWPRPEIFALIGELERRTTVHVVAPSIRAMELQGLLTRRRRPSRRGAARFGQGSWGRVSGAAEPMATLVRAGLTRGHTCVVAVHGTEPPNDLVAALEVARDLGAVAGGLRRGLAAQLGVRWAIEAMVAPQITAAGLSALREQLAGAPRCGWCRTPMPAGVCRRCVTETGA